MWVWGLWNPHTAFLLCFWAFFFFYDSRTQFNRNAFNQSNKNEQLSSYCEKYFTEACMFQTDASILREIYPVEFHFLKILPFLHKISYSFVLLLWRIPWQGTILCSVGILQIEASGQILKYFVFTFYRGNVLTLGFDSILEDPQIQEIAVKFPQNESCTLLLQIVLLWVVKTHITAFLMLILLEFTTVTLLHIALKSAWSTASAHTSQQEKPLPIARSARKKPAVLGSKIFYNLSNLLPCFCQQTFWLVSEN